MILLDEQQDRWKEAKELPLSREQLVKICTVISVKKIPEEVFRDYLKTTYKKHSRKELTLQQASEFIEWLELVDNSIF